MIAINYMDLSSEDIVRGNIRDEGEAMTVFLNVHEEDRWSASFDLVTKEDGSVDEDKSTPTTLGTHTKVVVGFPVRCKKPVSRANFINAAEAQVYGLKDASATASFTASLARKFRENPGDQEVKEHDAFIDWVKTELSKAGIK